MAGGVVIRPKLILQELLKSLGGFDVEVLVTLLKTGVSARLQNFSSLKVDCRKLVAQQTQSRDISVSTELGEGRACGGRPCCVLASNVKNWMKMF